MKISLTTIFLIFFSKISLGQTIQSGEYKFGLKLAFDNKTKRLTGYFKNHTGWDEETRNPVFSCIFYIEGIVSKNKFGILTYYPTYKSDATISGQIEIINNSTISIKLQSEHGGCWNVQHFADASVKFDIEEKTQWKQIRYVVKNKTYFYAEKSERKKQKAYLIKNDFVCIDKIEGEWVYCTFYGETTTKGWLKTADLNKI